MHIINVDYTYNSGQIKLNLRPITSDDEYPTVSIVTVTKNRPEFVPLMIRNYESIDYPKHLLEWVILDSSNNNESENSLKLRGYNVHRSDPTTTIGAARNIVNGLSKNEYIVHMDDDDFYPSISVVTRIRILINEINNEKHLYCVGSNKVNCYDLIQNQIFEAYDEKLNTVSESTLAYHRLFWDSQGYNPNDCFAECVNFIKDRTVYNVPSSFIITQFTHNTNTVVRRLDKQDYNNNKDDGERFMGNLGVQDYKLVNDLKVKLISKMPEYIKAINFLKSCNANNIITKFKQLDSSNNTALLKNSLIIEMRRKYVSYKIKGKTLVYYCGLNNLINNEWLPGSKSVGGSEEAVINLSRRFKHAGYTVIVYCITDRSIEYDGVFYKPYFLWNPLDAVDVTIIWRDPSIIEGLHIGSKKLYLDLHDAIELKHRNNYERFDTIFVKSEFHKRISTPQTLSSKVVVAPNGLAFNSMKPSPLVATSKYKENFALCTSSPDRCLISLLKMIPIIREKVPDFKVYWAYGFSGAITKSSNPIVKSFYKECIDLIENTEGFVNLQRLSQEEINIYYAKAKWFIYPTTFSEIDCISLTKALYYKCIPIVSNAGAIAEKLGNKVPEPIPHNDISIDYSLSGKDFEEFVLRAINIITNDENIEYKLDVSKYNVENIAQRWLHEFTKNK